MSQHWVGGHRARQRVQLRQLGFRGVDLESQVSFLLDGEVLAGRGRVIEGGRYGLLQLRYFHSLVSNCSLQEGDLLGNVGGGVDAGLDGGNVFDEVVDILFEGQLLLHESGELGRSSEVGEGGPVELECEGEGEDEYKD